MSTVAQTDPVTVAQYRSDLEKHRQWVRIEDVKTEHKLSDGQIIAAWRRGRIAPRLDVPPCQFWDDSGGCYVHLGDHPLQVPWEFGARLSSQREVEIAAVYSPPVTGEAQEWDPLGKLPTGTKTVMLDCGRNMVLSPSIVARLGTLWIAADEVVRVLEKPGEEVMTEALREAFALEPAPPPKGQKLPAQIDALVRVIEGMGYDLQNIPDGAKGPIFAKCSELHPEVFPAGTGALTAWRKASKREIIRHNQNRN